MNNKATIDWSEWKKQQEKKFSCNGEPLPYAMTYMLTWHGRTPGKKCGQCANLENQGLYSQSCNFRPPQYTKARPWKDEWPACGLFQPVKENGK